MTPVAHFRIAEIQQKEMPTEITIPLPKNVVRSKWNLYEITFLQTSPLKCSEKIGKKEKP